MQQGTEGVYANISEAGLGGTQSERNMGVAAGGSDGSYGECER